MDKIPPTNPPISPNANNFGNFNGRNSQNNQNSKDSSKDSEENKEKFDTIQDAFKFFVKQSEEHNNDSTNTITNSDTTAQILIPTNPYGSGNGGNNRLVIQTQGQSTTTEKDGRGDTTAHNGGFTQLFGEKDERSEAMGEGSESIGRISDELEIESNIKDKFTANELSEYLKFSNHKKRLENDKNYAYKVTDLTKLYTINVHLKYIEDITQDPNVEPAFVTSSIKTINKLLTELDKTYPELKDIVDNIEKQLKPLKEKYLPQKTKENTHNTHKDKSKSNDDFGMGM